MRAFVKGAVVEDPSLLHRCEGLLRVICAVTELDDAAVLLFLRFEGVGEVVKPVSEGVNALLPLGESGAVEPCLLVINALLPQSQMGDCLVIRAVAQDGRGGAVDDVHREIGRALLLAAVDANEPALVVGVIFEILNAPCGFRDIEEIVGLTAHADVMRLQLREGHGDLVQLPPVKLQNGVVIVFGVDLGVLINAAAKHQAGLAVLRRAEHGADRKTVDAADGKAVGAAVCPLAVIPIHHVGDVDRFHDPVARGVHIRAVDLVHVEDRNVEGIFRGKLNAELFHNVLADGIVLVFERGVDLAVFVVEIDASEMPEEAARPADDDAVVKPCLDQDHRVRIVNIPLHGIDRNALQMLTVPKPRIDLAGEIVYVKIHVSAPFKVLEIVISLYHKRAGKSRAGTENEPAGHLINQVCCFDWFNHFALLYIFGRDS